MKSSGAWVLCFFNKYCIIINIYIINIFNRQVLKDHRSKEAHTICPDSYQVRIIPDHTTISKY